MTHSAIQAAINIAAILGINPMQIISIRPENGSGYNWLYKLSGHGPTEYFIDIRKGNPIAVS